MAPENGRCVYQVQHLYFLIEAVQVVCLMLLVTTFLINFVTFSTFCPVLAFCQVFAVSSALAQQYMKFDVSLRAQKTGYIFFDIASTTNVIIVQILYRIISFVRSSDVLVINVSRFCLANSASSPVTDMSYWWQALWQEMLQCSRKIFILHGSMSKPQSTSMHDSRKYLM